MKLYHGSNIEIDFIDLSKGRHGKDFGKGFYVNPDYSQAALFSNVVVKREGFGSPIVNVFEFNEKALHLLDVKKFEGYTKEWAEFIIGNRGNSSVANIHNYDIVIGPIADDNVGTQIRRLSRGFISMEVFLNEIKFIKPSIQYFFGTVDSLKYLKKI